jgi:hypothetical protein
MHSSESSDHSDQRDVPACFSPRVPAAPLTRPVSHTAAGAS